MPYITQERRDEKGLAVLTRKQLGHEMGDAMENGGDLQYMLAVAIQTYLERKGLRYAHCEEIMGALTGAQAEFYRMVVAPYENSKIKENGCVYDCEKFRPTDTQCRYSVI